VSLAILLLIIIDCHTLPVCSFVIPIATPAGSVFGHPAAHHN
jgi:hypothetical protein